MTGIAVTYFDFPGSRGEEIRLALVLAGVQFEDRRISGDAFAKLKPGLPFGSVPVIEIKGHGVLSQTNAILRLIGRLHDLHPADPYEAARHDALMEAVEDLRHRISPTMRMDDPAERRLAREALAAGFIPHWARGVEGLIGDGPFVGGDRPGVADIKLYMADRWIASGILDDIPSDLFDGCEALKRVADGVSRFPPIVDWYATSE